MASRTLGAALLLCGLLAALLGAWFVSGWHGVKLQQAELRDAPVRPIAGVVSARVSMRTLRP